MIVDLARERRIRAAVAELHELANRAAPDDPQAWLAARLEDAQRSGTRARRSVLKYRAQLAQEGRHWLVSFADCPGCQTFGDSREDALERAREALQGWLEAHLVNGQVPPRPKPRRRGEPIPVGPRLAAVLQARWKREAT